VKKEQVWVEMGEQVWVETGELASVGRGLEEKEGLVLAERAWGMVAWGGRAWAMVALAWGWEEMLVCKCRILGRMETNHSRHSSRSFGSLCTGRGPQEIHYKEFHRSNPHLLVLAVRHPGMCNTLHRFWG
jgi:hypothetical protein